MIIWQDVVLAIGGVVGLASKVYALWDSDTQWARIASIPNAILYSATVVAFVTLELYLVAFTSFVSMLVWFGIGVWRAPDDS